MVIHFPVARSFAFTFAAASRASFRMVYTTGAEAVASIPSKMLSLEVTALVAVVPMSIVQAPLETVVMINTTSVMTMVVDSGFCQLANPTAPSPTAMESPLRNTLAVLRASDSTYILTHQWGGDSL